MNAPAPFQILAPEGPPGPVVFSSPHSGAHYPQSLRQRSRLELPALRASEDAYVDRLFDRAPEHGAPLLAAVWPRAWVDLNRSPSELDPAVVEGVRPSGLNQRIVAGLGVVPRVVSEDRPIYDGKIPLAEAQERIRDHHRPFHDHLELLLEQARDRHGIAVLFDCHSMPSEALRAAPRIRGRAPEIVLGDRFGASAGRQIIARAQAAFERAGFTVARNAPFAGGYITQRYGRPARGIHALQIEIDRGLYLDQDRIEPLPVFAALKTRIDALVRELCGVADGGRAMAAE